MRVCQFRHFGNEMRQMTTRRGDGNYIFIVTGMPGVSNRSAQWPHAAVLKGRKPAARALGVLFALHI